MVSTPFSKKWKKLMRKETTSTFTVTVTHKGPEKDFQTLFRKSGTVQKWDAKLKTTETKKLPGETKYTDEQKMSRLLFKESAEKAGLVYGGGGKAARRAPGTYNISYGHHTNKRGITEFQIYLCGVYLSVAFSQGLSNEGKIHIYDEKMVRERTGRGADSRLWPGQGCWGRRAGKGATKSVSIHIADPKVADQLTNLFKEWGLKYGQ